jgi:hypothetical protein
MTPATVNCWMWLKSAASHSPSMPARAAYTGNQLHGRAEGFLEEKDSRNWSMAHQLLSYKLSVRMPNSQKSFDLQTGACPNCVPRAQEKSVSGHKDPGAGALSGQNFRLEVFV